jgi:antitoxin FitA
MLVSATVPAIQVRDVPVELHDRLRERAAAERMSLSMYVLRVLERSAAQPSTGEWLASLAEREPVRNVDVTSALDVARRGRARQAARALRH